METAILLHVLGIFIILTNAVSARGYISPTERDEIIADAIQSAREDIKQSIDTITKSNIAEPNFNILPFGETLNELKISGPLQFLSKLCAGGVSTDRDKEECEEESETEREDPIIVSNDKTKGEIGEIATSKRTNEDSDDTVVVEALPSIEVSGDEAINLDNDTVLVKGHQGDRDKVGDMEVPDPEAEAIEPVKEQTNTNEELVKEEASASNVINPEGEEKESLKTNKEIAGLKPPEKDTNLNEETQSNQEGSGNLEPTKAKTRETDYPPVVAADVGNMDTSKEQDNTTDTEHSKEDNTGNKKTYPAESPVEVGASMKYSSEEKNEGKAELSDAENNTDAAEPEGGNSGATVVGYGLPLRGGTKSSETIDREITEADLVPPKEDAYAGGWLQEYRVANNSREPPTGLLNVDTREAESISRAAKREGKSGKVAESSVVDVGYREIPKEQENAVHTDNSEETDNDAATPRAAKPLVVELGSNTIEESRKGETNVDPVPDGEDKKGNTEMTKIRSKYTPIGEEADHEVTKEKLYEGKTTLIIISAEAATDQIDRNANHNKNTENRVAVEVFPNAEASKGGKMYTEEYSKSEEAKLQQKDASEKRGKAQNEGNGNGENTEGGVDPLEKEKSLSEEMPSHPESKTNPGTPKEERNVRNDVVNHTIAEESMRPHEKYTSVGEVKPPNSEAAGVPKGVTSINVAESSEGEQKDSKEVDHGQIPNYVPIKGKAEVLNVGGVDEVTHTLQESPSGANDQNGTPVNINKSADEEELIVVKEKATHNDENKGAEVQRVKTKCRRKRDSSDEKETYLKESLLGFNPDKHCETLKVILKHVNSIPKRN